MPCGRCGGWSSYNEALVRRAELLFSFEVLDGWDEELELVNDGRVGAPYRYPDSFISSLIDIKGRKIGSKSPWGQGI
ncbi:MAG: hypothetical protein QXK39_06490 [Nitrososphaerota archaeon]